MAAFLSDNQANIPKAVRIFIRHTAIALAIFAHCAGAAIYQVGPARTYTNLQSVARLLAPGDVVEVDGDATYTGGVTFDNDGTAAEKITIRGVRVNGLRPVISGGSSAAGNAVIRVRAGHYIFEGLDVTAAGDPNALRGFYNAADDTTLRDSVVHDCPLNGIAGATVAGSLTVQFVEVHHCGFEDHAHQIYVESANLRHPNAVFRLEFCFIHDGNGGNNVKSRVGRNEIYYNWIEGSAFHELDLIGADPDSQSAPPDAVREDSDVVGNVFYKLESSNGSVARLGSDGAGSSNGRYRFVNNTVIADRNWWLNYAIFKMVGRRESFEAHNNVFYRNGGLLVMVRQDPLPAGASNSFAGANNWVQKNSYTVPDEWTGTIIGTNPAFVDVTNFLLAPKTNSQLFNAGISPTAGLPDFPFPSPLAAPLFLPPPRTPYTNGEVLLRPVSDAIDIGAFEQSAAASVIVVQPSILAQPQGGHIAPGSNAVFSVVANGTAPLNYQWRFNGAEISGATGSSFTLANAQPSDTGKYSVTVSNIVGVAASASARLLVLLDTNRPVVVISSPPNNARLSNDVVTVSGVAADNVRVTGVVYQWNGAPFIPAIGTNNWSATLNLLPGTNTIHVKSVDTSGNESSQASRNFFFVVLSQLIARTNGFGSISPDFDGSFLEIGRRYQVTALPGANYVFTGWSGDVASTNAALAFFMQTNLLIEAGFVTNPFAPVSGIYSGLFADTNGVAHQSAGFLGATIKNNGAFTGKISVDGNTVALAGKFGLDGKATVTISRAKFGKPPLAVNLDLDFENHFGASDRIYGSVGGDSWTSTLRADRAVWSVGNPATAFTNRFTALIPGGSDAATLPPGFGCGLVTIDSSGRARWSGALADAMPLNQTAIISKNGDWPFYQPLYTGPLAITNGALVTTNKELKGCVFGWLRVTDSTLAGSVNWIKTPVATNIFYPNGFTNVSALIASRYSTPGAGTRAVNITSGMAILSGGNLNPPLTNHFVLDANNSLVVTAPNNSLKLRLTPQTGRLTGTFAHPGYTNKPTALKGVLLQEEIFGAGFFPGTNQGGSMTLMPE